MDAHTGEPASGEPSVRSLDRDMDELALAVLNLKRRNRQMMVALAVVLIAALVGGGAGAWLVLRDDDGPRIAEDQQGRLLDACIGSTNENATAWCIVLVDNLVTNEGYENCTYGQLASKLAELTVEHYDRDAISEVLGKPC